MNEYAIVTGASSGIGAAIAAGLCHEGYTVYGIGRTFDEAESKNLPNFIAVVLDLLETDEMIRKIREILNTEKGTPKILVNAAGIGYYGLHQELNPSQIRDMVRTNLEIPMILTSELLPALKKNKGIIVNVSSVTAHERNPHGCAYGATKAGLSSFSSSLFDETRKYGLRVITVQPDMTKTSLYRNADFDIEEEDGCYLLPSDVTEPVLAAIRSEHAGEMQITIRPQFHRIHKKHLYYSLFCCTESMKQILDQCLHYFTLTGIDYETEIAKMKERGELPCHNKKEGMERIEQLKKSLL